ncbi:riboflavin biosynthesis protein RibF [Nitzschia inconspicua]|uniref:Riboflavin biosynthesis protein RibF n=1 Tax=Nitzschia inconspicua TaxID=303405 RepID=A0A9K3LNE6_9STRA|nr:riboflavin biosynthesis protein RibF [Nitzschia inconspicua]
MGHQLSKRPFLNPIPTSIATFRVLRMIGAAVATSLMMTVPSITTSNAFLLQHRLFGGLSNGSSSLLLNHQYQHPDVFSFGRRRHVSSLSNNNHSPTTATTIPDRAKLLPQVLRYCGRVDQGYGRGGKQLGIPTANLPSSLFQNALQDIQPGVYFGWAMLEQNQAEVGPPIYKTVVNVGYSPTFEGQENKEKIIEAHLIMEGEDQSNTSSSNKNDGDDSLFLPDFYGVPMRLQLIGFLREEQKFDSFPDLVAQIRQDVEDSKVALDCNPYANCQNDKDFFNPPIWIGNNGGDESASWETQDMDDFLETLQQEV